MARLTPSWLTLSDILKVLPASLTNTGLVFLMLYIVYVDAIVESLKGLIDAGFLSIAPTFKAFAILVLTTNGVAEALVSAFITMAIVLVYHRYARTRLNT